MMKKWLLATVLVLGMGVANAQDLAVQVGAFSELSAARQQAAKVALLGVKTKVFAVRLRDGRQLYRVRTVAMKPSEATKVAQRLRENKVDVILVPR